MRVIERDEEGDAMRQVARIGLGPGLVLVGGLHDSARGNPFARCAPPPEPDVVEVVVDTAERIEARRGVERRVAWRELVDVTDAQGRACTRLQWLIGDHPRSTSWITMFDQREDALAWCRFEREVRR